MPKGSKQIKNFAGGLNTYADPRDIKDNEFQALDNVSTDENARIRLSGGFEKKEISGQELQEISFGRPSSQIAAIYSDFKPVSISNGDFSLTPANEVPEGWSIENGTGTNDGWIVGTPAGGGLGRPVFNISAAISANSVADMGSITSSNFKLTPGETYKVSFGIISDTPFFYTPEAELPRARIINDTLGKYISGGSITSSVDEFKNTAPQLIPKATSNLSVEPDAGETPANIGWGSHADWNAGTNMTIERVIETATTLQGYMGAGTNYVLKCDTGSSYNQSTFIYTDAIDISSYFSDTASDYKMNTTSKQFFFDCIYKTEENQGQWQINIHDETNNSTIFTKVLLASNGVYTNIEMGTNGWEYSSANINTLRGLLVNIPNSCTSISIKIQKITNGVGAFNITGMRLYPYNTTSLGGEPIEAKVGTFQGGFSTSWKYNVGYPNTWSQDTKPPYVTDSFSDYKISSLANQRRYHFDFSVPTEFEENDDWQFSINAGKWGSSQALTNLQISIYNLNITRISTKADVNDSHYILVPQYSKEINKTNLVGYQYNTSSKMYEKFPDSVNEMLPSFPKKAYINFTTIFGRTIISNGNFSESSVYTFFYDNLSDYQGYKVTSGEQFVPSLFHVETVADSAMQNGDFNALTEYINRVNPNHGDVNNHIIKFSNEDHYEGGYVINTRSGLEQKWCNSLSQHGSQAGDADHNNWYSDSDSGDDADGGPYWHVSTAHRTAGDGFNIVGSGGFANNSQYMYGEGIRFPHPDDQNMSGTGYPAWSSYEGGNTTLNDPIHKLMEWTSGILNGTTDTGATVGNNSLEGPIKKIDIEIKHEFYFGGLASGSFEDWMIEHNSDNFNPWSAVSPSSGNFVGGGDTKVVNHGVNIQLWTSENGLNENFVYGEMIAESRLDLAWDMNNRGDNPNNDYGIPEYGLARADDPDIIWWTGSEQGQESIDTLDEAGNPVSSVIVTFDFEHDEVPLTNNYALKIIPDQYGDSWGGAGGRVQRHFREGGAEAQSGIDSDTVRGIRLEDKWSLNNIMFYGYDGNYNDANVLNLTDEQVGLQIEMGTNDSSGESWFGTWYVKLTTVNYFDEESPIGDSYKEWSNETIGHAPTMIFQMGTSIDFESNMIKEVKIYMKKSTSDNSGYRLQLKVDLLENKMYAVGGGESVMGAVYNTDDNQEVLAYVMPRENLTVFNIIDSYTSETGLLEDEAKNQAMMTAQWKTATIVNNRMYVGNIMQEGKIYSDRMIKSEQNKFGILPRKNWIDVVINDGDEIVSLQSYMDKLLQFKNRKLFIINVSSETEGEFLEQTVEGIGINDECQIVKTIHGICWINERGLFRYDGNSINNLIEDKLAISKWKDTISGWDIKGEYFPIIGYDVKSDKLIILPTGYSSQDIYDDNLLDVSNITNVHTSDNLYRETWRTNVAYIYDFQRKSFTMNYAGHRGTVDEKPYYIEVSEENSFKPFYRVPPISGKRSNFYYDINGDLSILTDGEISQGKFVYNDIPSATPGLQDFYNDRNMRIITKDYDFGDPAIRKKVHKVYVTFKSTNEETILVENANLTKDFYASSFVKAYYAVDGSNNWKEFDSNKSKNYDATRGLVDEKSENTTTLTNAIASTDTTITVGSTSNILQDYVIKIGDEHMLVENVINSTSLIVKRGYGYSSDDINSYTLLIGINHDAASTIAISNGDWLQAELVPKESVNNIKSLKLMFVQAQVEATSTTIYSDEMIDIVDGPPVWSLQNTMQSITGQYTVNSPTNFSWAGTGEYEIDSYQYNFLYSVFTNDDEIFPGEKVIFEITVSNFTTNGVGDNNYIEFLTNGTGSGFTKMTFTGNDTQTQEWTRPEYEDWQASTSGVEGNGSLFYHFRFQSYTNVTAADIEINVKKDLGLQFSQTGNIPKGFQINDISIIHRTKNVR